MSSTFITDMPAPKATQCISLLGAVAVAVLCQARDNLGVGTRPQAYPGPSETEQLFFLKASLRPFYSFSHGAGNSKYADTKCI